MKDTDTVIDIKPVSVDHSIIEEEAIAVSVTVSIDELASGNVENGVISLQASNVKNVSGGGTPENNKGKHNSAKKPPRPPRGLSLDAADQRLIKELSELAMIKRARTERIKALKKMKAAAAKASSASSSSSSAGNFVALLFTILFCVLFIFRGCQPPEGRIAMVGSNLNADSTSQI
ncbi:uncharacterized protein LOC127250304 [Andrographis paniculata]|uniref:uncharacterized protein LOC127250304 n=1 Tax=Andrographis paniculata TaxID=175694 RepID=UPI0021E86143|nr:uncharacterized protein LOC127250304 [Andrographis paniculata]